MWSDMQCRVNQPFVFCNSCMMMCIRWPVAVAGARGVASGRLHVGCVQWVGAGARHPSLLHPHTPLHPL